jgi:alpha-galactosidase
MHQLIRLDGTHSALMIAFAVGHMPTWRHYGARLGSTPLLSTWSTPALRRLPPGSMDTLLGAPVLPCFGHAQPHHAALRCHRDGLQGIQSLVAKSFSIENNGDTHSVVLVLHESSTQAAAALEVTLRMDMHVPSDVLTLRTRLRNAGTADLQIDALAAGTVALPAALQDVGYFSGQWAHEYQWQRHRVSPVGWAQLNQHGRTSHESPPTCFVMASNADDHTGAVVAAHLAWSGNHQFALSRSDDGALMLQSGEWLAPGEMRLEAGETYASPALHLSWSDQGLNAASQQLHQYTRQAVLQWHGGTMRPRPVHLNTWEAVYFDHTLPVLQDLATRAAAVGVERFVLDDGWFPGRPNDRSGLGDWWPDAAKYPEGLGPLITHVHSLGMEFGLWVEPEMVNPDSALFRAHPDWALQASGYPLSLGRNQLVLDIARPEVSDYLFDKLSTLLRENAIAYFKWDMNRDLSQAQNAQGHMAYGAQVHALYALLARLRQAHPQVEIESCASGGGRMDLGVLRHTQRFWTSDNNDALSRIAIQSGAARLFPLEVLGTHVGPAPAHSTGRAQSMGFRCAVALFGHMGVEADVRHLNSDDQATLSRWIALYKAWRHVLHSGTFSQGRTANGVWWLVQTATQCVLGVFTDTAPAFNHHAPLALPSFATEHLWRVRLVAQAGHERARGDANSAGLEALAHGGLLCSASELRCVGLPLLNMNPESALLFTLELQA